MLLAEWGCRVQQDSKVQALESRTSHQMSLVAEKPYTPIQQVLVKDDVPEFLEEGTEGGKMIDQSRPRDSYKVGG